MKYIFELFGERERERDGACSNFEMSLLHKRKTADGAYSLVSFSVPNNYTHFPISFSIK